MKYCLLIAVPFVLGFSVVVGYGQYQRAERWERIAHARADFRSGERCAT